MEPFSMMLGYGLINSLSQLVVRPLADKFAQSGRREDMLFQMETKQRLDMESVRLNKEIDLENNINIQQYCHEFRIQEATNQFANQLKMWQLGQFNEKMWPLLTPFDHPSLKPQYVTGQQVPINIFLANTSKKSPYGIWLQGDVKNRLSTFIQTTYASCVDHPCICRIGDWKEGFQDAAFINALWYGLQGQPCIVINPIQSEYGEQLDLNVSMWGLAATGHGPLTQTVITGPFSSAIGRIKREETIKWKENGLPVVSQEMKHNFGLLAQEQILREQGKGDDVLKYLLAQYRLPQEIQSIVLGKFSQEFSHTIACVTGMFADIYHLIEYGAEPYLPNAINLNNNGSTNLIPDIIINHYRKALTDLACSNYLQDELPFAYFRVAKAISFDDRNAHEILQEGVGLWANRKLDLNQELQLPDNIDGCVKLLKEKSSEKDRPYLEMAKLTLISLNEEDAAREIDKKIHILPALTKQMEWHVSDYEQFRLNDFHTWVDANALIAKQLGATEAVAYILPSKAIMIAFVDTNAKVVFNDELAGLCVRTNAFYVNQGILDGNLVEWSLKEQRYITNKDSFMQKKEFGSFKRLGEQLDALVRNLRKVADSRNRRSQDFDHAQTQPQDDFVTKVADFFMENNSIESESVEIAEFDKVRRWIVSKLPVRDAAKAYILYTKRGSDHLVCVFFSDKDDNGLFGAEYPKKRILCGGCDSEMQAFLNNEEIGAIIL